MPRGRPPKAGEKMDVDLRIPVTKTQRDLVRRAAEMEGMDMAAWVRSLVLEKCSELVDKPSKKRGKQG